MHRKSYHKGNEVPLPSIKVLLYLGTHTINVYRNLIIWSSKFESKDSGRAHVLNFSLVGISNKITIICKFQILLFFLLFIILICICNWAIDIVCLCFFVNYQIITSGRRRGRAIGLEIEIHYPIFR